MQIKEEKILISQGNEIAWSDVNALKMQGSTLIFEFFNGSQIKMDNLSMVMVDQMFRSFENYLKKNPRTKQKKQKV